MVKDPVKEKQGRREVVPLPIAVGWSECFVDKGTVEQRDVMEEKEQAIETLERRALEAGSRAARRP